jgi:hypothetical protein
MFLRGKSYAVLGIAFFSMLIRLPFDLRQFHVVDEGVIGTLANIILRGGLVYRDGWCHRGPVLDYVYAGIFSVFGNGNMVAVHLVTSLLIALQTLLLHRMASLLFERRVALVASCLFAFFSTFGYPPADTLGANVEIWMNFFVLVGLNLFIPSLGAPAYLRLFLSASVMGLAPLTKQVAFSLYPFLLIVILYPHLCGLTQEKRPFSKSMPSVFIVSIGFFLPLLVTVSYYYLKGAINDFVSLFLFYNFFYIKSFYRSDPTLTMTTMFLNVAKSLWHAIAVNFSPKRSGVLYSFSLITFAMSLIRYKNRNALTGEENWHKTFLVFLWFLFSILPLLVLGRGFHHYFIQLLPIVCILSALAITAIFFEWLTQGSHRLLLAIPFIIQLLFPVSTFIKGDPFTQDPVLHEVTTYVRSNSHENDTIFVWGWNTELYVLTNRRNASRFIFCTFLTNETPGAHSTRNNTSKIGFRNSLDLWLVDLKDKKPKFIIDGHRGVYLYEDYPLTRYPEIFAFISNNYRVSKVIGNYHIYEKMNQ